MKVEAVGLPAALKAWHARKPEPVLTMTCGVSECDAEVGAVYRSPKGAVVESRMHPRQEDKGEDVEDGKAGEASAAASPDELAGLAAGLGVVGLTDEFMGADGRGAWLEEPLRVQVDLLRSELYWQDPTPMCPRHGELRVDQAALVEAVRTGAARYDAALR